ncbi:MAG: hypothetical protein AB1941_09620 [Gemmatimonadota bacterium]
MEMMAGLAGQLEEALGEFEAWGIRINMLGRLPACVSELRRFADAGQFPDGRRELKRAAHVVRDAQEFVEIANVLPETRLRPLADSLQQAVAGQVGAESGPAAQFQSELWVGSMIAQSGRWTAVITDGGGKRPDFIVQNGTYLYPIEVKRPVSTLNAVDIVDRAGRQLRGSRYHGGGIVVDLSDCLPEDVAIRFGRGQPTGNPADENILQLTGELNHQIYDEDRGRIHQRRIHIFALLTFARTIYWDLDDLQQIYLFRKVVTVEYYRGSPNNLRGHRARALAETVHQGITVAGHQDLGQFGVQF